MSFEKVEPLVFKGSRLPSARVFDDAIFLDARHEMREHEALALYEWLGKALGKDTRGK